MHASRNGNSEILKILLFRIKIDINAKDINLLYLMFISNIICFIINTYEQTKHHKDLKQKPKKIEKVEYDILCTKEDKFVKKWHNKKEKEDTMKLINAMTRKLKKLIDEMIETKNALTKSEIENEELTEQNSKLEITIQELTDETTEKHEALHEMEKFFGIRQEEQKEFWEFRINELQVILDGETN